MTERERALREAAEVARKHFKRREEERDMVAADQAQAIAIDLDILAERDPEPADPPQPTREQSNAGYVRGGRQAGPEDAGVTAGETAPSAPPPLALGQAVRRVVEARVRLPHAHGHDLITALGELKAAVAELDAWGRTLTGGRP